MRDYNILSKSKLFYFLILINILATIFGLYYYYGQLMTTPLYLWIFVLASPLATLFMAISIYLNMNNISIPLLDALAFIGNSKYGLWTVFCLIYYSDTFFASNNTAIYSFMLISHFGMFLQSFIVFYWNKINWKSLSIAFVWYEINDIVDYTFGTHTELYTDYVYPAEVAAFTFSITVFILGLAILQKDQLKSTIHEVQKIQ